MWSGRRTALSQPIRDRFEFAPGNPRALDLTGIGRREVWDIIGLKKEGQK